MKNIEAVISPCRLDAVRGALSEAGIGGLTVCEAQGCGRQPGRSGSGCSAGPAADFLPGLMLSAVVDDQLAAACVQAISEAAGTGGKIMVTPVVRAVRIRTREENEAALTL